MAANLRQTAERGGGAKRRGARSIGSIATELTGGAFARHGLGGGEIAFAWPHIAGERLAGLSRPERLARARRGDRPGGTLHILADAAATVEVHYASSRIVAGVNALLGYPAVSRVAVRQALPGEMVRRQPVAGAASPQPADAEADGRFAQIRQPSLRSALARLGAGVDAARASGPSPSGPSPCGPSPSSPAGD